MRTRSVAIAATLVWFGAGCGSGVGTSQGTGSSSLLVDAEVNVSNTVDNATQASQFRSELTVRLEKAGVEVHGATVKVSTGLSELTLVEEAQTGRYHAAEAGYGVHYQMSVVFGADFVDGISLDGPDVHSFDAPLLGAQVPAGQALEVRWSPSGADTAQIDSKELDDLSIIDNGSYTLPGSVIKGDKDKPKEDRVRLSRHSTVTIAGGTPGSALKIDLRNELPFLIVGAI